MQTSKLFALLMTVSAALLLSAAEMPLETVWEDTFRPDCRPGAVFSGKNGKYSITLDEKTGDYGRWRWYYALPKDAQACRFSVKAEAAQDAFRKGLIVCTVTWLDKAGDLLRTAYLEPDAKGVFTRTLVRPEQAEQVLLTAGVRYFFKPVIFSGNAVTAVPKPVRKVRIATAKVVPAWKSTDCNDNLKKMDAIFQKIAATGRQFDLIIFPETMLTRGIKGLGVNKGAQPIPGPHTDWAAGWAKKLKSNVVVSLREITKNGRFYNSAAVIDRNGKLVGVYHKTQLTEGEYAEGYCWGKELPVFDLDFGRIGVLICWDMWFPDGLRVLRLKGAEVIAYPIASTSFIHYDTMWKTRAMENGVVLAASIAGGDKGCPSRIVSAHGEVLSETNLDMTFTEAEVDLADLQMNIPHLSAIGGEGEARSFYVVERNPEAYRLLSDRE